jgi:fructose-1,6-bisphosphatase I
VDVDGQMGTIFGIYRRATAGGPPTLADFLQPGQQLRGAGYVLYGPSTMFVYTAGGPVHGFTLDRSIGTFFLTHPDLRIVEGAGNYSVNEANEAKWDDKTRALVRAFRQQQTRCGKRSARYAGALVGDFHRTLLKGGIYMYPGEVEKPEGKLRLLYENAPLALVCEQAGGMATDGKRRILDVAPTKLHMRTPLYIGSKGDVEEAMRALA